MRIMPNKYWVLGVCAITFVGLNAFAAAFDHPTPAVENQVGHTSTKADLGHSGGRSGSGSNTNKQAPFPRTVGVVNGRGGPGGVVNGLGGPWPTTSPTKSVTAPSSTPTSPTSSVPASFPSQLHQCGRDVCDSNNYVLPMMKSFNMLYAWPQGDFNNIYAAGARMVRVLVVWSKLEPTQGTVDMSYVTGTLDPMVQRAVAAHLYVQMDMVFNASVDWPAWAGTLQMSNFLTYGQMPTQFIAGRYGNPISPEFTLAAFGFGIDEPPVDNSHATNMWPNLESQERTFISWFRAYAPNWIGVVSGPYGAGAPVFNEPCAAENGLQWKATNASETAYDSVGSNVILDVHDYSEGATTATNNYDGRDYYGEPPSGATIQGSKMAKVNYSVPSQYPSPYGGSQNRTTLQSQLIGFMCPYVDYADNYDGGKGIPIMIGEMGWAIGPSTTSLQTGSGYNAYLADQEAAWNTASPVIEEAWNYSHNQANGQDPFAAAPDINGSNEWQPYISDWLNS